MEMKQLEYFCAIVEAGTISGAAKALHMTQPPLSYQMKMLEEELEVADNGRVPVGPYLGMLLFKPPSEGHSHRRAPLRSHHPKLS